MDTKEQMRLLRVNTQSSPVHFSVPSIVSYHCSAQCNVCNANLFATSDSSLKLKDTKDIVVCKNHKQCLSKTRVLLRNTTSHLLRDSLLLRWKAICQLLCYGQRRRERTSPLGPVVRVHNVGNVKTDGADQHSNRWRHSLISLVSHGHSRTVLCIHFKIRLH